MFCHAVLLELSWVFFFIDHLKVAQITFIELAMSSEGSERSFRYLCFARLIYHEMIPHLWFLSKAFLYSPVKLNDASLGASEAAMIKHIQRRQRRKLTLLKDSPFPFIFLAPLIMRNKGNALFGIKTVKYVSRE